MLLNRVSRPSLIRTAVLGTALLGACGAERSGESGQGGRDDAGAPAVPASDAGPIADRAPFPDAGITPHACTIGVPDDVGDWSPLAPGGDVPMGGAGQAGLTAQLAVRVAGAGLDDAVLRAVLQIVLENTATGVTADGKPWDLPVRFACTGAAYCERSPALVEVSHLAKLPELEGTAVDIRVRVLAEDDPTQVLCQTRSHGVLARR